MAIVGRTATIVENSSANSITGSLPSDRVTGDLVLAIFAFTGNGAITGPAGWNAAFTPIAVGTSVNPVTIAVYWRFSPATAPTASTTFAADRCTVICQAYGNVNVTTPLDATPVITQAPDTATPLTVAGITIATAGARFLSIFAGDTSTRTPVTPSGMTLVKAYSAASNGRMLAVADEVRSATGATGSRSWNTTTALTVNLEGVSIALRPQTGLALTGSVTAAGAVRKAATKNAFTGNVTASGVFSKLKVVFRIFDGSTAPVGVLVKSWRKILTGAVQPLGLLRKLLGRTFLASITASGFFRKAFVRRFTGAIATTGNVVITFLGRAFGRPGRAALTITPAGEARIRVRRK